MRRLRLRDPDAAQRFDASLPRGLLADVIVEEHGLDDLGATVWTGLNDVIGSWKMSPISPPRIERISRLPA